MGSGFSSPALSLRASVVDLSPAASGHGSRTIHSGHHSAHATPPRDEMIDRNYQFARLVAGLESEVGEAPPAYDAVVHDSVVEVEESRGRTTVRAV